VHAPEPLHLAPAVIVTSRDERGSSERVRCFRGLQQFLTTNLCLENKVKLGPIYAVLSDGICVHKILSLKFTGIFADGRGNFA